MAIVFSLDMLPRNSCSRIRRIAGRPASKIAGQTPAAIQRARFTTNAAAVLRSTKLCNGFVKYPLLRSVMKQDSNAFAVAVAWPADTTGRRQDAFNRTPFSGSQLGFGRHDRRVV